MYNVSICTFMKANSYDTSNVQWISHSWIESHGKEKQKGSPDGWYTSTYDFIFIGSTVNAADSTGSTPLHEAALLESANLVSRLLLAGKTPVFQWCWELFHLIQILIAFPPQDLIVLKIAIFYPLQYGARESICWVRMQALRTWMMKPTFKPNIQSCYRRHFTVFISTCLVMHRV